MTILNDVKKLLSGTPDEQLAIIERRTKERLISLLGVLEVPATFEYVLYEVTLKRFNRIGNEGMTSVGQEGLSMSFPDSDFDEYAQEFEDFRIKNDIDSKRGRFRLY